jgi:hypothetical protein
VSALLHAVEDPCIFDTMSAPVVIPATPLTTPDLEMFRGEPFDTLIKYVVDISRQRIALGGEMHADAEEELLESGSNRADLWGGNLLPWLTPPRIEHTSLINIRPAAGNRAIEIDNPQIRTAVEAIVKRWVSLPW